MDVFNISNISSSQSSVLAIVISKGASDRIEHMNIISSGWEVSDLTQVNMSLFCNLYNYIKHLEFFISVCITLKIHLIMCKSFKKPRCHVYSLKLDLFFIYTSLTHIQH